jgi:hypothetical protein
MPGRTARRLRDHAHKPQRPQIQLFDEDVDPSHRIVFSHVIVEDLGEQNASRLVFALNQPLDQEPRLQCVKIRTQPTFSHSLRPKRAPSRGPSGAAESWILTPRGEWRQGGRGRLHGHAGGSLLEADAARARMLYPCASLSTSDAFRSRRWVSACKRLETRALSQSGLRPFPGNAG